MDHQQQRPVLSLKQGKIQGVIEDNVCGNNDQFLAFRGIPYAKPPIGKLRFKDPLLPEGWKGIRDGSKFGNICIQLAITGEIVGSEDCLYLNVYKPRRIEMSVKLPVMVWIHGGGFNIGSGNDNMYSPDYIVRKDIILVTINYRLGVLGFLNLEDEVAPGNQGLKDQVMALRWVRDNIVVFGGDPQNVTIFGGSAGAASVHYLTISPLAEAAILRRNRRLKSTFKDFISPPLARKLEEKNITVNDFKRLYFGEKSFDCEPSENIMHFLGDVIFIYHIFEFVRMIAKINKYPVYFYKFSYECTNASFMKTIMGIEIPGATHGDELFYMFYGKLQKLVSLEPHSPGTKDYKIMEYFTQLWTDFAKTGNPTPITTELIPVLWEPLKRNTNEYNYFNIDENLRMESIPIGIQRFEWNTMMKNKL
uniref:esterase B1-like isoform X4 n=1 Tax=Vespula vulgaris TaxID=7454 RepID=UPI00223C21C8|nr:esterase B1-like isoform X4 [Vespula vulgaris]